MSWDQILTEYERGYIDAMTMYAVWKDGVQYVGVMRTPLDQSVREFLAEHRGKQ